MSTRSSSEATDFWKSKRNGPWQVTLTSLLASGRDAAASTGPAGGRRRREEVSQQSVSGDLQDQLVHVRQLERLQVSGQRISAAGRTTSTGRTEGDRQVAATAVVGAVGERHFMSCPDLLWQDLHVACFDAQRVVRAGSRLAARDPHFPFEPRPCSFVNSAAPGSEVQRS